jgi:hypothetical protein
VDLALLIESPVPCWTSATPESPAQVREVGHLLRRHAETVRDRGERRAAGARPIDLQCINLI